MLILNIGSMLLHHVIKLSISSLNASLKIVSQCRQQVSHWKWFTIIMSTVSTFISPRITLNIFHWVPSKSSLQRLFYMTLGRHGCKLQLDWCTEAYNHEVVILVSHVFTWSVVTCSCFLLVPSTSIWQITNKDSPQLFP